MTEDEMVDGITYSMDVGLGGPWELVFDREAWHAADHGYITMKLKDACSLKEKL